MIPVRAFEGREVAVFGLGGSGLATARALESGGARPICWDDDADARARAEEAGLALSDLERRDWSLFAALVLSPGVPHSGPGAHRVADLARLTGVEMVGDVELFAREIARAPEAVRPKVVAITGTNGKSTCSALLGHILTACNRDGQVGGNIGVPALSLELFHAGAVYVLELSSYQLDLSSSLKPDVAVFLNISPDHLDRHGDMDGYVAAKRRIFRNQTVGDVAVIGVDDPRSVAVATELAPSGGPRVVRVSSGSAIGHGAYAVGGVLYDAIDGRAEKVADLRQARALMGRHNWQNAAAAYAAARALGLEPRRIADALMSFAGLPHRMEVVAKVGATLFVNDSKATNAAAARHALANFENVYWIAGGRAKSGGVAELAPLMPRVAKAYFIGEAAHGFAAQLKGRVIVEICRDLDAAVASAARDARNSGRADPVVLLSPACASFDQFASFEARGNAFRRLVQSLAEVAE
ncbi:MAG: UDP-N-acetylmuramoyl-L-alanine--D-glutamate ligase [Caulobacterales bacterium]|nr:UDP-N-acetylmuramoyl-L-alanine--D-glutamate ligase [Caulobacterales bacterium]